MSEEQWLQRYNELMSVMKTVGQHHLLVPAKIYGRAWPFMNLAFSSSGEDLWLRQYMKARFRSGRPGFYLDVGCNHPISTSNTYLFYVMGWHGVCVDANLQFETEFKSIRPRDTFVNAAVSDLGQSLYFAALNAPAGHKVSRVAMDPNDFPPNFTAPVEVPAMTLAEILRQHVAQGTVIDFMTIDIEDSELPALRSNDWSAYRPRVVFIECGTGFEPLNPLAFPTISFLHGLGYQYRGFSNNNVLMTEPGFDERNGRIQKGLENTPAASG